MESPWIVFPSHVLSLVGRFAFVPPGSAHSRMLMAACGVKKSFAPTETEMVDPLWRLASDEISRDGGVPVAPALCMAAKATATAAQHPSAMTCGGKSPAAW